MDKRIIIRNLAKDATKLVECKALTPPLLLDELNELATELVNRRKEYKDWYKWAVLFINNALWKKTVGAIPFRRKLLLIPQCLRHPTDCPAQIDEYGLICESCERCVISRIHEKADKLELMCMVAEGSTMTARIIAEGQADALIGVGCFSALEKAFDQMVENAVPGQALPLFNDGCIDTSTDVEFLLDMISETSDSDFTCLSLKPLLKKVQTWFNRTNVDSIIGPVKDENEEIARNFLVQTGKRYRPFLCLATGQALSGKSFENEDLLKLAIAVESFHKASLIHDDIEDQDDERNGGPSLHKTFGVPVALNTGDFLLGEGYRLISKLSCSSKIKSELLDTAVEGHIALCFGQGNELLCTFRKQQPDLDKLLEIYRKKTSPAFNVALQFAAVLVESDKTTREALADFSDFLGIGYQIRDDLEDRQLVSTPEKFIELSIVDVLKSDKKLDNESAVKKAGELLNEYKQKALKSLSPLTNCNLKSLLFQLTNHILKLKV